MKNVEKVHSDAQGWSVPISGLLPLKGWAVRYVAGMRPDIKAGYWLSRWRLNSARDNATFAFEPELTMCFNEQSDAQTVSNSLRNNAEIDTRVVQIGEFGQPLIEES